jgi:diacylglycerol kinase
MKFSIRRYKGFEKNVLTKVDPREQVPLKRFGRNRFKAKHFLESLKFAAEGLWHILKTQRNFRIDLMFALGVSIMGVVLGLTPNEWTPLALVVGLVLYAEAMNTAVEYTVDLFTQGEFDMRAKVIKDISAGACLLAAFCALIVGSFIFIPRLIAQWPY